MVPRSATEACDLPADARAAQAFPGGIALVPRRSGSDRLRSSRRTRTRALAPRVWVRRLQRLREMTRGCSREPVQAVESDRRADFDLDVRRPGRLWRTGTRPIGDARRRRQGRAKPAAVRRERSERPRRGRVRRHLRVGRGAARLAGLGHDRSQRISMARARTTGWAASKTPPPRERRGLGMARAEEVRWRCCRRRLATKVHRS